MCWWQPSHLQLLNQILSGFQCSRWLHVMTELKACQEVKDIFCFSSEWISCLTSHRTYCNFKWCQSAELCLVGAEQWNSQHRVVGVCQAHCQRHWYHVTLWQQIIMYGWDKFNLRENRLTKHYTNAGKSVLSRRQSESGNKYRQLTSLSCQGRRSWQIQPLLHVRPVSPPGQASQMYPGHLTQQLPGLHGGESTYQRCELPYIMYLGECRSVGWSASWYIE